MTNVTYDVVFTFHTCDRIALRWQQNEYTTADIGYGRQASPSPLKRSFSISVPLHVEDDSLTILYSTVSAGKYIEFKGTDLLTVNLASKKVENVTTSADLLNDFRALGYNLGVLNQS